MLLEYSPERTSRLPASDRRSSPRALCLLQPELAARPGAWSRAAELCAGLGEGPAVALSRSSAATTARGRLSLRAQRRMDGCRLHAPRTCLTGQTPTLLRWLAMCQPGPRGLKLRLDLLRLGEDALPRLSESLEIPLAEQRWLLESWVLGDRLTHFQRLGLGPTLDQGAIRRGYLATCQRLHPDRYYGRHIGRFAGVLVDLFHLARAAHVYLADPRRCAWYLAQLAAAGHEVPDMPDVPDMPEPEAATLIAATR
jgi:hypothetical protein